MGAAQLLIAPLEALTDPRLGDQERRVLLALFSFRGRDTNTVWPSVDAIAERAGIHDKPRISKLTASLAAKGWLTKKKRGFTGCNEYALTVPELANLAEFTNLVEDANTNLANNTKSNLVKNTKYKEQTNDQTIEQTSADDLPALPEQINSAAWGEWVEYRRERKKKLSNAAIAKQLKLLAKYDKSTQQGIIDKSIQNDWQGLFEPDGKGSQQRPTSGGFDWRGVE